MKKLGQEVITKKAVTKIIESDASKSSKIKALFDGGIEVKEIATLLGIRYNFAYNVISNYCNIEDIECEKQSSVSKRDQIKALFAEGKSNKEIAKELKTNYNYVLKVLKA